MTRILIVDDDAQFRKTLHLALTSHGFEVETAADGEEALQRISFYAPDLVVLDWHMPEVDGIQTCQEIRTQSSARVIMMSAGRLNSRSAAIDAGAAAFLTKPFAIEDLLRSIEATLRN